ALQGAHGCAGRPAHASAQAEEDRRTDDVPHRDVRDGDVFEQRAIHGFQGQPLTPLEDAVGYGDVAETAVGLGTELDSSGMGNMGVRVKTLVSAVEQR